MEVICIVSEFSQYVDMKDIYTALRVFSPELMTSDLLSQKDTHFTTPYALYSCYYTHVVLYLGYRLLMAHPSGSMAILAVITILLVSRMSSKSLLC